MMLCGIFAAAALTGGRKDSCVGCIAAGLLFAALWFPQESVADEFYLTGWVEPGYTVQIRLQIEAAPGTMPAEVSGGGFESHSDYHFRVQGLLIAGHLLELAVFDTFDTSIGSFDGTLDAIAGQAHGQWQPVDGAAPTPFQWQLIAQTAIRRDSTADAALVHRFPRFRPATAHATFLNDAIAARLGELSADFRADLRLIARDPSAAMRTPWEHRIDADVWWFGDGLVSILFTRFEYSGGVHGNTTYSVLNFRIDGNAVEPLSLADLFADGSRFESVLAGQCLDQLQRMGASAVVEGEIRALEAATLRTFLFGPGGLVFAFAPYEVASYAEGSFFVEVPYRTLRGITAANSPLRRLTEN